MKKKDYDIPILQGEETLYSLKISSQNPAFPQELKTNLWHFEWIYISVKTIYIYIYIYIYIFIHRQTVSFYQNSSVWLDTYDTQSWDRNPSNFMLELVSDRSANKRTTLAKGIFKVLCSNSSGSIHLFTFLYPIGYQSAQFFQRAFALCERQPKIPLCMCVCVCIYIYIHTHTHKG